MTENVMPPRASYIRRLFVAHPKSLPDEELQKFVERIRRAFAGHHLRDGSALELEITTGRESAAEWEKSRVGKPFDWTAWQMLVTGSTKPWGGEPRFHYFVVGPELTLGRATAGLVMLALKYGRQVLYVNDQDQLQAVRAVGARNTNSWKDGFVAVTG